MALIPCPKCGSPISDKAVRCPKCGELINGGENLPRESMSATVSEATPAEEIGLGKLLTERIAAIKNLAKKAPAEGTVPEEPAAESAEQEQKKKRTIRIIAIAIAAIAIVTIVIVLIFALKPKHHKHVNVEKHFTNSVVIEPSAIEYDSKSLSGGKYYIVSSHGKYGLIDKNYDELIPCEYSHISCANYDEGYNPTLFLVSQDGLVGLYNSDDKKFVFNVTYSSIDFVYGEEDYIVYATLTKNGKKGLAYIDGEILIDCKYDDIDEAFFYIYVRNNGKWGLYSGKKLIFPCEYSTSSFFYVYEESYSEDEPTTYKLKLRDCDFEVLDGGTISLDSNLMDRISNFFESKDWEWEIGYEDPEDEFSNIYAIVYRNISTSYYD